MPGQLSAYYSIIIIIGRAKRGHVKRECEQRIADAVRLELGAPKVTASRRPALYIQKKRILLIALVGCANQFLRNFHSAIRCEAPSPSAKRERWFDEALMRSGTSTACYIIESLLSVFGFSWNFRGKSTLDNSAGRLSADACAWALIFTNMQKKGKRNKHSQTCNLRKKKKWGSKGCPP